MKAFMRAQKASDRGSPVAADAIGAWNDQLEELEVFQFSENYFTTFKDT